MLEIEKDNYKKKFISITDKINSTSKRNLKATFQEVLDLLELPHPNKDLNKYFSHPSVIRSLLINVLSNRYFNREDRSELRPHLSGALKKLKETKEKDFVRFRILGPEGNYPNFELSRNNCNYSIYNQIPVIWTKNKTRLDQNILDCSVINWLTRNELKLATSILCSGKSHRFYLFFTGHNTFEIDWNCVSELPNSLRTSFLAECFELNNKFTSIGVKSWNRFTTYDSSYYEYQNFKDSHKNFKRIFDNFSIQNDLLLRTCNYLVKSIMHWENTINAEEAISSVFFCLEGCLHLIQKKYGNNGTKLDFKLLGYIFENEIENGVHLLNFIQDGYRTRITLVHPEPVWGSEWKPFITSEDFYEYFRVCISLMNFILIDEYEW